MSEWMMLSACADIAKGTWKVRKLDELSVLVINLDGFFYVVEDVCSHDGAPLDGGFLDNDEIVCPRHGARFCARTGDVTCPPAYEGIHAFPTKIEEGYIFARDDRFD